MDECQAQVRCTQTLRACTACSSVPCWRVWLTLGKKWMRRANLHGQRLITKAGRMRAAFQLRCCHTRVHETLLTRQCLLAPGFCAHIRFQYGSYLCHESTAWYQRCTIEPAHLHPGQANAARQGPCTCPLLG